jgi:hypothetical protein
LDSSLPRTGSLALERDLHDLWLLANEIHLYYIILLHASHPPAAATTLLVALGGFKPTVHDALIVIIGVLIVATIGERL